MSCLSLKEQHLSVNILPSTTLKLLRVNYYTVSQPFGGIFKKWFKFCPVALQEICHVLSLHQEASDSW